MPPRSLTTARSRWQLLRRTPRREDRLRWPIHISFLGALLVIPLELQSRLPEAMIPAVLALATGWLIVTLGRRFQLTRVRGKKEAGAVAFAGPVTSQAPSYVGRTKRAGEMTHAFLAQQSCLATHALLRRQDTSLLLRRVQNARYWALEHGDRQTLIVTGEIWLEPSPTKSCALSTPEAERVFGVTRLGQGWYCDTRAHQTLLRSGDRVHVTGGELSRQPLPLRGKRYRDGAPVAVLIGVAGNPVRVTFLNGSLT